MTTSILLNRLADIVSRLRHMWDDTDGDTHMPVEESDDISAVGTDIANDLACADQWLDIAGAIRSHAASIDHAARVERDTNAALLATITAAHAGDLSAASESATLAFALLGLDSAFRVRLARPDVGLPEGWTWHLNGIGAYHYPKPGGPIVEARIGADGRMELFGPVPLPVIAAVLRAAGVAS